MIRNPYFFDTESIGYYGPTVLIQYAIGDGPVVLHHIWDRPVIDTLELIEQMAERRDGVVGFNLAHDWFHINRTYNVLSYLPKSKPPKVRDYADVEDLPEVHDGVCVKPVKALDLLLHGRKNEFQATLNQKDIRLKKVPRVMAEYILGLLKSKIDIPAILFSRTKRGYEWQIEYLHDGSNEAITPEQLKDGADIDPNFVNIVLRFAPSISLKAVWSYITGEDAGTYEELVPLPKVEEYGWWPTSGMWTSVASRYISHWRTDTRALFYAKHDVTMTRDVDTYYKHPVIGDVDSNLACEVGAVYWHGFHYDRAKAQKRSDEMKAVLDSAPINVNSPKQVRKWILEVCSPLEKAVVKSSSAEVLQKIANDWAKDNPEASRRAKQVMEIRRARVEYQLLSRLLIAGRLYALWQVVGTKSNRMSGGSLVKKGGSINPQGIKKGDSIRPIFTLADMVRMCLCGGDFEGFEVSIADAVYGDPILRAELMSGKKIHGLFGAAMYGMTYEQIIATKDKNINDPEGYYQRAKRGFFLLIYGGGPEKLSKSMWISLERAVAGLEAFLNKYVKIREYREKLQEKCFAVYSDTKGGMIKWREPVEYAETFLGFKRSFALEYKIMRCLYDLANNPPDELRELGKGIRLVRRERVQTASGAAMSALFGVIFGMQQQIFRAWGNNDIQSPGGELTKGLQHEIWQVQPSGIHPWLVIPMNVHDEIEAACHTSVVPEVKTRVNAKVNEYRLKVPLIDMCWESYKQDWSGGMGRAEFSALITGDIIHNMVDLPPVGEKTVLKTNGKTILVTDGLNQSVIKIGKSKKYVKRRVYPD